MAKSKGKAREKRPRVSVTDAMKTVQEKLRSSVERELVKIEDRGEMWVCVPGAKGHKNYIYQIKDRLKADRFKYNGKIGWHKHKSLAPEHAMIRGLGACLCRGGVSPCERISCARVTRHSCRGRATTKQRGLRVVAVSGRVQ
jgi:hypothetical protein